MGKKVKDRHKTNGGLVTDKERDTWRRRYRGLVQGLTEQEAELYGMRPVTEGGKLFCGVTEEQFAINGTTYAWRKGSKLKWGIMFSRLGALSDMDVKDCITAALKEISDCCDISHEFVKMADSANIYMMVRNLDGKSGVLADCEIPPKNADPNEVRLRLRFDDAESWVISDQPAAGTIDFYRVALHELEHGHGLGHKPASISLPALIAPTYSRTLRNLQPLDKEEHVRRYGIPTVVPPPPPSPPGTTPAYIEGRVWQGNVEFKLPPTQLEKVK